MGLIELLNSLHLLQFLLRDCHWSIMWLAVVIGVVISCQAAIPICIHQMSFWIGLFTLYPIYSAWVRAILLLVQHDFDLVAIGHAGVVGLVVLLREAFNYKLFALSVAADLVLIGSFVMAYHLIDLWDDLSAVGLITGSRVIEALWALFQIRCPHDVAHALVLVDLHDLCLLVEGCIGSRVESSADVGSHRGRIMKWLHSLMRLLVWIVRVRLERLRHLVLLLAMLTVCHGYMLAVKLLF